MCLFVSVHVCQKELKHTRDVHTRGLKERLSIYLFIAELNIRTILENKSPHKCILVISY